MGTAGLDIAGVLRYVQVLAKAYDNPIPGFKTPTVGNLRLWEALPVAEFDLSAFNEGKYDKVRPACPCQASQECLSNCWRQIPTWSPTGRY